MTYKGIIKIKEKERLVNEAMEEIHDKGMGEGRGEEYQKRQIEWWKECDKWEDRV